MLHKMPIILLGVIGAVILLNPYLPMEVKAVLYAVSLSIKSIIVLLLPLIVFGLLFKTMVSMAGRATMVIVLILLCVCTSNTLSTFLSHYMGSWVYDFDLSVMLPQDAHGLTPAWTRQFPILIANDKAMFLGIASGILFGVMMKEAANKVAIRLEWLINKILRFITCMIPFFVMGFVVKLQHDGVIQLIVKEYSMIFMLIALAQFSYIILVYFILNQFNPRATWHNIQNMLPAAIAGFSAMSSAAAMPLTIAGVEKSSQNKDLAAAVVPVTVNIHLVGDCIAIPIFAYAVMKSYGFAEPALMNYLIFVFYFVVAKFSVAAIPGGGIMVMLPVLEANFGFTGEMLSLITALYVLFDPVITCANVLGNGAFAKMIDRLAVFKQAPVADVA